MAEPAEFVELLVQHQHQLLRFILPLVGDLNDAQDVLQETAKALWRKFGDYDPAQPFLPWARQFARNEVLMHHRRRKRITFLSEELLEQLAEREATRDELACRRQAALSGCLEKLPEADRRLVHRRYLDPHASVDGLAQELGQTANVLYKSLGRIRKALLSCIEHSLAAEGA